MLGESCLHTSFTSDSVQRPGWGLPEGVPFIFGSGYIRRPELGSGTSHRSTNQQAHRPPLTHITLSTSLSLSPPTDREAAMPSTVAVTAAPVASSLMYQVDQSLRTLGFDLKSLVKSFDIQTVGLLTLLVVVGIFLFDFLNYGYSSYYGDTSTYTSYGRSLVTTAAKICDQRDELGVNPYVRGGRGLDSMTQILDSLADAVLKYEEYESNDVDRTRESKDL